jgi:protein involved in polysaccharide export with SLBB domain
MSRMSLRQRVVAPGILLLLSAGMCSILVGCGDQVRRPSPEEVKEFELAGPSGPSVDVNRVVLAKMPTGPYRVVPGDILQLHMPGSLNTQVPQSALSADGRLRYDCRVYDDGTIVLPVVGRLTVARRTLAEIESAVMMAYCPKYVANLPSVYATVLEYKTYRVSIVGSVGRPGIYTLRHDQASLVALLMEAGGVAERGAAVIRIARCDAASPQPAGRDVYPPALPLMEPQRGSRLSDLPLSIQPAVISGAQRAAGRSVTRATFTREGPLNTSGWLVLERGGKVLIRRWIDLASESQRRMFLEAAAETSEGMATGDLQERLSGLATHLESRPIGGKGRFSMQDPRWKEAGDGRFVTRLQETAADTRPSRDAAGVTTLVLPVRGLNVPFADVALEDGDSVVVEPPAVQFVSVVGLVMAPGNFPYPADAQYNLIQAVAFAGGLNLTAEPRYVSIYRLNADGTIASITLQLVNPRANEQLTDALALPLKPGDVVFVEHTPRTRTNLFLDRVLRISLGLYVTPDDFSNNND